MTNRRSSGKSASVKYPYGSLLITPAARRKLVQEDVMKALARHYAGNAPTLWDLRNVSLFQDRKGTKFWITTEGDVITILLPWEY